MVLKKHIKWYVSVDIRFQNKKKTVVNQRSVFGPQAQDKLALRVLWPKNYYDILRILSYIITALTVSIRGALSKRTCGSSSTCTCHPTTAPIKWTFCCDCCCLKWFGCVLLCSVVG